MKNSLFIIALITFLGSTPLLAQNEPSLFGDKNAGLTAAVGYFAPTTGEGGTTIHGGLYFEADTRLVLGGELFYKEFKSSLFGSNHVRFSSITMLASLKYLLNGDQIIPYLGGYLSTSIHYINKSDVYSADLDDKLNGSVGGGVLCGFGFPVSEKILFYAEGRFGFDLMQTKLIDNYSEQDKFENYGGFNMLGGIMLLF